VTTEAPSACLGDDQVVLLLEGKLPPAERAALEAHLDGCESCRLLVAAAAPIESVASRKVTELTRGVAVGRYLVLSLLGRGGMGRVYAAYDPDLDRRVAVKLLHAGWGYGDARRLLAREARALGKLSHPNVVQVYDVGEHDGDVFVAMELVEGEPLDRWLRRDPPPSWREVLAVFLDAARGISAAHAKGLVHRDVKPSNILRGKDGRVRVADFGLAAREHEDLATSAPPSIAAPLAETLPAPSGGDGESEESTLVGTPLYMAPEQHEAKPATAASDQYSLCVALYEALYGEVPFSIPKGAARVSNSELCAKKRAGPPAAPPAGSEVPPWIFRAITRGLAPEPDDRWPSLDALIAALQHDPDARKRARRLRVLLTAALAFVLGSGAAAVVAGGAFRDPCEHPERELAGAWDEDVKSRVRAAFAGTGRAHAEDTTTRVRARLDAYGSEWAAMRGEVCRAARGGAGSRGAIEAREACLERRRGQLRALTALLAEKPDPEVLDKAAQLVAGLPPVAYCADTEALLSRVPPPDHPALRARVAALQPRADRIETLYKAGKFKEALPLGEAMLAENADLPYAPLRAQIELTVGRLRSRTGDFEGSKSLVRRAAVSAAEGKDDSLAVVAWAEMLFVVANYQKRLEEAAIIRALGATATVRSQDAIVQAQWANCEGVVLQSEGKYAEAKIAHERALALREMAVGPDHPDTAASLHNLGTVLCALGDCWAAKPLFERAVAISQKSQGPGHPDTGASLGNLGNVLRRTGDYAGAVATHRRALAIKEEALGPDHPSVASSLTNLGNALFDTGDYDGALAAHQRALAIKEKAFGPDHLDVVSALIGVGRDLVQKNQIDAALPMIARAIAIRENKLGPTHAELGGVLLVLGEAHLARGALAEAVTVLERALALGNPESMNELRLTLAEALFRSGKDRRRAHDLAEEARAAYERMRHPVGLSRAKRWLAEHPESG
jgi:serine/threonine-protein kinase